MPEPRILLDYSGHIDIQVIDSLLTKLKKTREFSSLNKTTGKRTYAMVVECLENIYKHSSLKLSDDQRMQPRISVREENDTIVITAGNPISLESKDKLIRRLDHLNHSDGPTLKTIHENKISSDLKQDANGAGLGLIYMALTSGNTLKYSFNTLINNYLYFEIEISLNKYIMRKLIIDQTPSSPKVILDPEKKIFYISGESRPPDVREFYDQILSWLDEFSSYLLKSEKNNDPVTFNFDFEYFNSSSGKLILDICKILAGLRLKGINITVKWHFEKDDADMLEVGKEMSKIVKFPFEYVQAGAN